MNFFLIFSLNKKCIKTAFLNLLDKARGLECTPLLNYKLEGNKFYLEGNELKKKLKQCKIYVNTKRDIL